MKIVQRLMCRKGKTNRFYVASINERTVLLHFGRIGTEGATMSDTFVSPKAALASFQKRLLCFLRIFCYNQINEKYHSISCL